MARATPLPPDERRAAIIAATTPLLRERGREVSTREIAEAAGIAEGTIFRVFASKEELIDAVLDDAFDPSASYQALLDIDPALPLQTRVANAVAILQQRMNRVFGLVYALGFRQPPDAEQRRRPPRPDRALETGMLAAVLAPDAARLKLDPERAASMLGAFVLALSHPMLRGACLDEAGPDPLEIAELFLHGVAAPAAGAPRADTLPTDLLSSPSLRDPSFPHAEGC
ncbi:TetR/AcrR family transcriptional regulator [Microlunatus ginsengisoli]|uniref:TetR/AcrR family transcriptional regulator n=1 Tax=Microlunatus ginsengisoli TaxID=363863 RepID=UPI0031D375D5